MFLQPRHSKNDIMGDMGDVQADQFLMAGRAKEERIEMRDLTCL